MQADREKFNSMIKLGMDIYTRRGVTGIYRGFCVTLNRDFISYGSYFWVYYELRDYWEERGMMNSFKLFCAGGMAGVVSWIIGYPFDPIKTMIQADKGERVIKQYEAVRIIYRTSGMYGFFKGLTPVLIRAFIVHGVIFKTNEIFSFYLLKICNT